MVNRSSSGRKALHGSAAGSGAPSMLTSAYVPGASGGLVRRGGLARDGAEEGG